MTTPFSFDALDTAQTLALDASAGTGKTHTLTTIALRLIAEGRVTIEQLLIVTFTNAATAELKVRLLTVLRQALNTLNGVDSALDDVTANWLWDTNEATRVLRQTRIQQAVATFDDASIVTIHGFCQRMLTYVGVSAGLPLDAAVTDDDEIALQETLDDLAASVIGSRNDPQTAFLLDGANLARFGIDALAKKVLQLPQLRLVDDDWQDTDLRSAEALSQALDQLFATWSAAVLRARTLLFEATQALEPMVATFLADPFFDQNSRQRTYRPAKTAEVTQAMVTFFSQPVAAPSPDIDAKKQSIQANAPYLWFTQHALERANLHGTPPKTPLIAAGELLTNTHQQMINQTRNVIAHGIFQRYQAHRANRQVMTYDDLLRQLHQAVTDPTRKAVTVDMLRTKYSMALIDEFQDTDAVQWEIFSAVFSPTDPLIVIGDPKQAIYQFRGADVATYLRARNTMGQVFTLDTNWRSDDRHVAAVNAIFTATDAFDPYGITFAPSQATHPNRLWGTDVASGVHVRTVFGDGHAPQTMQAIVEDMAAHAVTLLGSTQVQVGETWRAITPGDLAVLVRTNRLARHVQTAFNARGVPATIQRGGSVYASEEAQGLHQLLAAIQNPHALGIVCGAGASGLIQMPIGVLAAIQDGTATGEQQTVFAQFTQALDEWQQRWSQHGVFAAVMAATGSFAPQANAERMFTNVRHLAELLATAEQTLQLGPDALVAWFAQKRGEADAEGYRADDRDELRLDGNDDAVKIATIHGAKGLEYPIVFTGDLWRQGPTPKNGLTVFTDPDATPHAQPTLDLALPLYRNMHSRAVVLATRDSQAEQVRLAYVALTRAAHATVVWCPQGKRDDTSVLGALMHSQPDDASYRDVFAAINTRCDAPITLTDVQNTPTKLYLPHNLPREPFTTRTQHRIRFDTPFRHTSFSALTRHNQSHGSVFAVSRSQSGDDDRDDTLPDVNHRGARVPLATFPRGTRAGNLLHHVFEQLDFVSADQASVQAILAQQARNSRFHLNVDEAATGLLQVLATPLGTLYDNATLRHIPRHARADEMGFTIPLAKHQHTVTLHALTPVLAHSNDPLLNRLATQLDADAFRTPIAGFLTGSIDSLLRLPNGRYVVIDYKSNYIGDLNGDTQLACYAPTTALANTMTEHFYTLQALLYLVVSHRYLTRRVPGYNQSEHLAGAAYLFVRGMVGETTPEVDGRRFGVASINPESDLLIEVNAILARAEQP